MFLHVSFTLLASSSFDIGPTPFLVNDTKMLTEIVIINVKKKFLVVA